MSRSALCRHEFQRAAKGIHEPLQKNVDHQPKANEFPLHGNLKTFNLNNLLFQNIMHSSYFHALYELTTYHEVVDEIYNIVDHAEPLSAGTSRTPSSCFCILVKLFTMKLTIKQLQGLLKHKDSTFIRCIGFLYLRYGCSPDCLWQWFEPYLEDPEEFVPSLHSRERITLGKWVRMLLEEQSYYQTLLPRIPTIVHDRIKVGLLLRDRKIEREKRNLRYLEFLTPGTRIKAMYADDENEPAMYSAVIDAIEGDEYWVSFPEYGNCEKVSLGDIEYSPTSRTRSCNRDIDRNRSRSRGGSRGNRRSRSRSDSRGRSKARHLRSKYRRSRSRSCSREKRRYNSRRSEIDHQRSISRAHLTEDLLAEVRKKKREKAEAVGKDYAHRPASYKGALSMKIDRYTTRKRSRSHSPVKKSDRSQQSKNFPSSASFKDSRMDKQPSAEAVERMRKLKARYGDASTK